MNENENSLQNFQPKGLFWALLCGRFNIAKYLIKENIFDPNEMVCGEINHIFFFSTTNTFHHYNNITNKVFR
tara:strand:- start:914 stop:1129 length:216 start_codon:yes stop_codon:yes gene_type:complete